MHLLKARTESSKRMDGSSRELKVSEGGHRVPWGILCAQLSGLGSLLGGIGS